MNIFNFLQSKQPKQQDRIAKTILDLQMQTLALTRKDIARWRSAWQQAINIERPNRRELYAIYNDAAVDLHLSGCVEQRKGFVKARSFKLVEASGKESPQTELFNQPWFKQFIDLALEATYWGHSLIELGDVYTNPAGLRTMDSVLLIPRTHVIPERGVIIRDLSDDYNKGMDYRSEPFTHWLVEVGQPDNLGLYLKAATQTIPKKNMMAFWDQFGEIFGMPIRIAKTTSRDPKDLDRIEEILSAMGSRAYGVFQEGTDLEMKETARSDAYNVYNQRIERANSELSKLILAQTMTVDNGSSKSQSETHLDVFRNLIESDADALRDVINTQLIPRLIRFGFPLDGLRFDWDYSMDYTPEQKVAFETMILNRYEVDPKYFQEEYKMKITAPRAENLPTPSQLTSQPDFFA